MARETMVLIDGMIVTKSIDGELTPEYIRLMGTKLKPQGFGIITDNLPGGVNGIVNHADGKRYDSKSQYTRAVKAKGCEIVGNDIPNPTWKTPLERGVRGDFNVRPALKEAVQRHLQ